MAYSNIDHVEVVPDGPKYSVRITGGNGDQQGVKTFPLTTEGLIAANAVGEAEARHYGNIPFTPFVPE